jgi:hypothetical protein
VPGQDTLTPGGPAESHCLLLYSILSIGVATLRWATAVEAGTTSTYNHSGMQTEGREPDPKYWSPSIGEGKETMLVVSNRTPDVL